MLRRNLKAQNSFKKLDIKMELYTFTIKINRIAHIFPGNSLEKRVIGLESLNGSGWKSL